MKKKQNKSTGVSGFQIALAIALTSISAIAFASSFSPQLSNSGDPATDRSTALQPVSPAVAAVLPHSNLPVMPEVLQANERETSGFLKSRAPQAGNQTPSTIYPDSLEWKAVPAARPQAPRAVCSSASSGTWNNPGIWSCGFVPTAADHVEISDATTVTIDTAAVALDVTVGQGGSALLQYDPAVAQSLTVGGNVTITAGAAFQANPAGTVTTHVLSIGGSLINNGGIDFSQNGNASQVSITFTGTASATWSGNGFTNLKSISGVTLNKGTSNASLLTFTPGTGSFFVNGGSGLGFLGITNGTFEIAGTNAFANPVFGSAAYTIPATGGFHLNNAAASILGQNGSPNNNGLLWVTAGIMNIGTVPTNVMGAATGASFILEGGTVNVAGRLTSANAVSFTMTNASTVLNICTVGGCVTAPSFGFTSVLPTNVMTMSGGNINLVQANVAGTPVDWNQNGTMNYTGGTLNIGTAATAAGFTFRVQGNTPAIVINNTTNNKTLNLSATAFIYGDVTIPTGTTFNPNTFIADLFGSTFTNNGTVTGCGAASTSRLQFVGSGAQSYTGSGTVCTAANPIFAFSVINKGSGVTIDPTSPSIFAARLLLFSGNLINANKVDVNQAGTSVMVIQRGGVPYLPPGSADVPPSFTGGTSFLILVYSQASTSTTTGVEIPASRTIRSLQHFNTNGVTLAGGPLSVIGAGGAAPDSIGLFLGGTTAGTAGGPLNTSSSNLLTVSSTVTGALLGGSENSYVNGPIARVLPANLVSGSTYVFPVGKGNFKGFELVNPTTNAGGTVTVQAEVFDADSGGTAGSGLDDINHNRFWSASITSGGANFTNSNVRVTELNSGGNALGQSATQNGAYGSAGGTLAAATVQSSAPVTSLGFFTVGRTAGIITFPGGTYTVGTGGNYATLTAAMADLGGGKIITGPITYSLLSTYSSATETFPIVVPRNGGSNATNTITIKPDAGATPSITGTSTSALLRINGCFVTLDGSNTVGGTTRDLTIKNNSTATNTAAVWVSSQAQNAGATNVTIKNNNIAASGGGAGTTTGIFGIFAGGTAVGTNGSNNNSLTIQNNQIDTAFEGIAVRVTTILDGINTGLNINNNSIGSANAANFVTSRGIELIGAAYPVVSQNEIFNQQTTTIGSNLAGIELGSTVYYAQVTRNRIHDMVQNATSQFGAFGITTSTSTNNFSNSIVNNAVWGISAFGFSTTSVSFDAVGIRLAGGSAHKVYFNSVNMTGAKSVAANSAAFAADSTTDTGLDLRDNVLVNAHTGPAGSKAYASFITSQTAFGTSAGLGFGKSNYNDYWSPGTGGVSNFINFYGVDHTTLTAWRASTQDDANSKTADPLFLSASDLRPGSGSPLISMGLTIPGITIDLLGNARCSPPNIGAYEQNPCSGPPPVATNASSQKVHGGAGTFNVNLAFSGSPEIECRSGGPTNDYTMIITFTANVTVNGSPQAEVISGSGTVGTGGVSNGGAVTLGTNTVTVPLTSVTNAQTITVRLNSVNGVNNVTVPMSVLVGDTTGEGTVNSADILQTKAQSGQSVTSGNFRTDVIVDGTVNSADVSQVKARSGTALP